MNWPSLKYFLLLGLILFAGCKRDLYDVPFPSDITKTHREAIGEYINQRIIENPVHYPMLQITAENSPAFDLIQTLYGQVTNTMRLDNKSPTQNSWLDGREWKVRIIDLNEQMAFVVPGGDLYLSKGILKALESESELYYLMAMESTLMNERYLLREMITAYSTRTLVNIAENQSSTDSRIEDIILDIPNFQIALDLSEIIGYQVSETICNTSLYRPLKGEILENQLSKTDQWLSTRPIHFTNDQSNKCGTVDTKGLYQSEVLDRI